MAESTVVELRSDQDRVRSIKALMASQSSGGSGTFDGVNERLTKLEARVDGMDRHLGSMDGKLDRVESKLGDISLALARVPTREFLLTTMIAAVALMLASALAIAALTFNIADYASKMTQQAEQSKPQPAPAAAPQQPIVIMVPSSPAPLSGPSVPTPSAPSPAPTRP